MEQLKNVEELGTDALAWAEQLARVVTETKGWSDYTREAIAETALGYFSNAIEHAKEVGKQQGIREREIPGEALQVEKLIREIKDLQERYAKAYHEIKERDGVITSLQKELSEGGNTGIVIKFNAPISIRLE